MRWLETATAARTHASAVVVHVARNAGGEVGRNKRHRRNSDEGTVGQHGERGSW